MGMRQPGQSLEPSDKTVEPEIIGKGKRKGKRSQASGVTANHGIRPVPNLFKEGGQRDSRFIRPVLFSGYSEESNNGFDEMSGLKKQCKRGDKLNQNKIANG